MPGLLKMLTAFHALRTLWTVSMGACIFTSLDLKSGNWQVELDKESIPLMAFTVGPLGFYEFVRMPFGLTNVPATFQRLIESCLGELHLDWCIIYLDDIIIFSKNPDEHITRLEGVFEKLAKAGLKFKPSKCEFFHSSLKYLGHICDRLKALKGALFHSALLTRPQTRVCGFSSPENIANSS